MKRMVDTRRAERASSWKEAFERVQKGTDTVGQSVEEFVKRFKDAEDKNFDLVMYINHVQEERRQMEDDIARVERQNEELQKMYSTQDNSRQRIMQHMQERLEEAQARASHFGSVAHGNTAAVHTIKRGLSHVLSDLGTGAFGKSIDTSLDAINPTNLMTYLGVLEQRAHEITITYLDYCRIKTKEEMLRRRRSVVRIPGENGPDADPLMRAVMKRMTLQRERARIEGLADLKEQRDDGSGLNGKG